MNKTLMLSFLLAHILITPAMYRLTHPQYNPGFFSVFNTVLGALNFYENSDECDGLIVDFEDRGLFYEKNYGPNSWEYYFEPIHLSKGITESDTSEKKFPTYKKIALSLGAQFDMSRERGNELIQKYVRLKPALQNKLDTFIAANFGNNYVIGIHYRGTDKKWEAPMVAYETISNHLQEDIALYPDAKIFVATDDAHFLAFMQREFSEKVTALDAIRSSDGKPVHHTLSHSGYQKGEDAVLDCLLLSRCSKLYKMASNLSNTSIKFNPSIPVIELNRNYHQEPNAEIYNLLYAFNTIIALLDRYEQDPTQGFKVNFPIRGTKYTNVPENSNWWNLHFMPLSVGSNPQETCLPYYVASWEGSIIGGTSLFEISPDRAHELITRYITLQPHIAEKIDAFVRDEFQTDHIIAIYYNKTPECLYFMQDPVSYDQMLNRICEEINQNSEKQTIFLATSDVDFFEKMKQVFPSLIYAYNPIDQEGLSPQEWEERALIQCILLSKAQKVIGTSSELLKVVRQFNPKTEVIELGKVWLEKT